MSFISSSLLTLKLCSCIKFCIIWTVHGTSLDQIPESAVGQNIQACIGLVVQYVLFPHLKTHKLLSIFPFPPNKDLFHMISIVNSNLCSSLPSWLDSDTPFMCDSTFLLLFNFHMLPFPSGFFSAFRKYIPKPTEALFSFLILNYVTTVCYLSIQ